MCIIILLLHKLLLIYFLVTGVSASDLYMLRKFAPNTILCFFSFKMYLFSFIIRQKGVIPGPGVTLTVIYHYNRKI